MVACSTALIHGMVSKEGEGIYLLDEEDPCLVYEFSKAVHISRHLNGHTQHGRARLWYGLFRGHGGE